MQRRPTGKPFRRRDTSVPAVWEVGEAALIRRLAAVRPAVATDAADAERAVVLGSGDDAAILQPTAGLELIVTTDALVEGVHYRPEWLPPSRAGARLAEMNLSDAAAMAAAPRWAVLQLAVRRDREVDELVAFQQGLVDALGGAGAAVVGGNVTATTGPESATLTLLGEVERGRAWTRFGGRPGDLVAITGSPGRAGAGARLALERPDLARDPRLQPIRDAWLAPRARVGFARALAPAGAVTAAIDVSDGLAGDLARLCEASGVGARLEAAAFPVDPPLDEAARLLGAEPRALRLAASDDYELLLAIDPARRTAAETIATRHDVPLHVIGTLTEAPGLLEWVDGDGEPQPIAPAGWDPFGGPPRS